MASVRKHMHIRTPLVISHQTTPDQDGGTSHWGHRECLWCFNFWLGAAPKSVGICACSCSCISLPQISPAPDPIRCDLFCTSNSLNSRPQDGGVGEWAFRSCTLKEMFNFLDHSQKKDEWLLEATGRSFM